MSTNLHYAHITRRCAVDVQNHSVRGHYVAGSIHGEAVPGYADELGRESDTETFVALRAMIDNWRWAGVPFYLRTGKRMQERYSEIVIQFRAVPGRRLALCYAWSARHAT